VVRSVVISVVSTTVVSGVDVWIEIGVDSVVVCSSLVLKGLVVVAGEP